MRRVTEHVRRSALSKKNVGVTLRRQKAYRERRWRALPTVGR